MRFDPSLEQRFSDWQRGLTLFDKHNQDSSKVLARQQTLIAAVRDGRTSLVKHLRDALKVNEAKLSGIPELPRRMIPAEFRDPPFQMEREIYEAWTGQVRRREAANPLFWTLCHIRWISTGFLGDRLEGALLGSLSNGSSERTPEAATRNFLRRMGGLPHVRGKVSVLSDCPMSRAWWRGQISDVAARNSRNEFGPEVAHKVLHSNNDAWARLVGDSVRRVTVINHPKVRAALICQYRMASREVTRIPAQEMQAAVRLLARHGPSLAFDCLGWPELTALVSDAITQVQLGAQLQLEESDVSNNTAGSQRAKTDSLRQRLSRVFRR